MSPPDPPPSPAVWEDGGPPRSRRHGDVYFSRDDGLAESRAVFLAGCGLPHAWVARQRFTVGELGFGTGLNIAALLELWSRTRRPGAHLSIFTVEVDPLSAADVIRALSTWPELAPIAGLMTARWPGRARGFHRIDLPELSATIDVAVMEAAEALAAWQGAADTWFLDGFAPSLDPHIWRSEVINLIARRSAPGAQAATYTVAGAVRRALIEAGFAVERAPGHGRKRERLEARLPGQARDPQPLRVAVIGAGIAGAALYQAFSAFGVRAAVFDAAGPGAGGSGGPGALMAPRLDAGLGSAAALFAQAARTAARLYEATPGAVIARGALQLKTGPKDGPRFAAIAASDLFEPGGMRLLSAEETTSRLGEAAPAGLAIEAAMVLEPTAVLKAWLGEVALARVTAVERAGDGASGFWRLKGAAGEILAEADAVCIAAAMETCDLVPDLAMTPVRGQASFTVDARTETAAVFGAYAIPTRDGVLIGATHDRGETVLQPRPEDRRRNLEAVASTLPKLACRLSAAPLADWCAVRATTGDYLPLAGRVPGAAPGLWVLTGLGSRGFCLAPLLAEHLAAEVVGAPTPLPRPLADLVDPGRFAARAARKGRPRS